MTKRISYQIFTIAYIFKKLKGYKDLNMKTYYNHIIINEDVLNKIIKVIDDIMNGFKPMMLTSLVNDMINKTTRIN